MGLTGAAISEKKSRSFHMTVVFEYFFEFSNNSKKGVFCEYCECLNADPEGCGCGIDTGMVDSLSETLDLTLFKRSMIKFSSNVIGRYEIIKKWVYFRIFSLKKKRWMGMFFSKWMISK